MRKYVIFSILIIAGLLLLLGQSNIDDKNSFWYITVGNIANTFLVGATLSLLYQLVLKREEDNHLMKMLKISFSVHDSGLRQILTNSADYKFSPLLQSSNSFVAVMNDGLRWVGNHSVEIEERFDKAGTVTEFYIVNPDSDFCKALAAKTEVKLEELQNKILQTKRLIESTYERSKKKGNLKIYHLKNYPTQSIFIADEKIVVTPYQTASGRNVIPLFEYEYNENKKSIGFHITNDVENMRKESTVVYEK